MITDQNLILIQFWHRIELLCKLVLHKYVTHSQCEQKIFANFHPTRECTYHGRGIRQSKINFLQLMYYIKAKHLQKLSSLK